MSSWAAKELAKRFGGDLSSADWRHFGRLAGFTNRKHERVLPNGLGPFVRLRQCEGKIYNWAPRRSEMGCLAHNASYTLPGHRGPRADLRRPAPDHQDCDRNSDHDHRDRERDVAPGRKVHIFAMHCQAKIERCPTTNQRANTLSGRLTPSNYTIRGYIRFRRRHFVVTSNAELQSVLKRLGNRGSGVRDLKTSRQCQRTE